MELAEYHRIASAEDSHWWYRSTRTLMRTWLAPWLRAGIRTLDVGCGPGGNGAWLAEYGDVVALDIEPVALEYITRRGAGQLPVRGDAVRLPVRPASFDIAVAVTVLYHLPCDDAAVGEIAKAVRPDGAVMLVEPAFDALSRDHDAQTHGLRRYRRDRLAELARVAGLTVQRASYAKSFLVPVAAALAIGHRLRPTRGRGAARSDLQPRRADRFVAPVLARAAAAEDRWLRRHAVGFGTSALVLATRPAR
jgi:SAM-dependent methyltransferase